MATTTLGRPGAAPAPMTKEEKKVIFASSLGTVFEWYDFYLYGSLAAIIAKQFFSGLDAGSAFIFALLAFAAGFIVRPFGALVFGRLGDMIGRKYTFLVTILIMGLSTFIVGILPSYASIGVAAPVILIGLRLLQGLALGGEYGGAATYVAEHAPHGKRGAYTAWIQTTATLGLFLSLMVILGTRTWLGEQVFADWGWRVPFLVSIALLAVSVWIRLSMNESPAFKKMKEEGKTSKAPLTESFGQWKNLKIVILALVGLTAGQAVVWYTGQFYALFFLDAVAQGRQRDREHPDRRRAAARHAVLHRVRRALGSRSAASPSSWPAAWSRQLTYFPLFNALTVAANPALAKAQKEVPITVHVDPAQCSFQGSPIAREVDFRSSCDLAKRTLAQASVNYNVVDAPAGTVASIKIGPTEIPSLNATLTTDGHAFDADSKTKIAAFKKSVADATKAAGYPASADPAGINKPLVVGILFLLVIFVTMVYGPIAAMLVELFPTRIRYTSMSLPYHIGNGWFGGLLPTTAFAIVAQTGNIYNGLWYPIIIAGATFVIGMLFVRETKDVDIYAKD